MKFKRAQTDLLLPPTIDEVKREASLIKLPVMEAESFFYYYQSNGWKVGKNRMKCWRSALQGWRIRWLQRQSQRLSEKINTEAKTRAESTVKDIQKGLL